MWQEQPPGWFLSVREWSKAGIEDKELAQNAKCLWFMNL